MSKLLEREMRRRREIRVSQFHTICFIIASLASVISSSEKPEPKSNFTCLNTVLFPTPPVPKEGVYYFSVKIFKDDGDYPRN